MAQSTFSIRMDEKLKKQFDELCNEFGMNATTAFNVFARAVVREKKIPFEIAAPNNSYIQGINAFQNLRASAKDSEVADMSLDLINEEINVVRQEKANL